MRAVPLFLLLVLLVGSAQAAFGAGESAFVEYAAPSELPGHDRAGEPTIGIPWNTDSVFFQSGENTYRIRFDTVGTPTWEDVTPPYSIVNVDPMLHADSDTARIWAGGLDGPCSIMAYSDDDGESWLPAGNMCTGPQFDHQSIGSGPYSDFPTGGLSEVYPHATYYCAQLAYTACATSFDGGQSWGPITEVLGGCGGLHGHIRVSPITGTVVVPMRQCDDATTTGVFVGEHQGFGYTTDNGATWNSMFTPTPAQEAGFDPSAQFTRDSGWMYFGQANAAGAAIGLSKDEGASWELIGGGMGVDPTEWLDVGQFHDPPVVLANFADVQAGDDDRVAFSFMGVEDSDGDGAADEYPDDPFHTCNPSGTQLIWYYYVATSFDAGSTWTVTRASDDPVQVGGIWGGQTDADDPETHCRNVLDFNDMDIDSTGRIHIAFADGCTDACADDPLNAPGTSNTPEDDLEGFRSADATLIRQVSGKGLFAAYDGADPGPAGTDPDIDKDGIPNEEDDDIDGDDIPNEEDENPVVFDEPKKGIPAAGPLVAMMALASALVLRRRV